MTPSYWQFCLRAAGDILIALKGRSLGSSLRIVFGIALLFATIGSVSAASVPSGFTETLIAPPPGGWNQAVGITFEENGRMYVWERVGRVWFKDPADTGFTLLLDIREEVGVWEDHGLTGFALHPNFRANGFIYLLYVVDRHHLLYFGTPSYNPNVDELEQATIGRLTRYTCRSSDGFRSVEPASRSILIGATKETGIAILSETHGIGSLVFAKDGTLLLSCGDSASPSGADIGGTHIGSWAPQAVADGILRPKEDIGAYRSQLLDCNNGKILRLDPITGNGVSSNPFYEPGNPGSRRSRVWVLGLRNPFRIALKPDTGSHYQTDGNPGTIYMGDVGWVDWEEMDVATGPGQNFGWPIYEGLTLNFWYERENVFNPDAPNPLYPAAGCSQYFLFKNLLKEDTLNPAGQPPFINPCNPSLRIPSSIPQFLHTRPLLDWHHSSLITRTPIYGPSGDAQIANLGSAGSPVSGTPFQGIASIGGTWYTGTAFPTEYQNTYFFADWGARIIKNLVVDTNDRPVAVRDFASDTGNVVSMVQHPTDGSFYFVTYTFGDPGTVRKLAYTGNRTPVAVASVDQSYGATPFTAQFTSVGSSDPDGQPITYSWDFGDGSPISTQANPSHVFAAPVGVPTMFTVTLTVADSGGLSAQKTLIVSINNTPPAVTITSPPPGALYSMTAQTTFDLTATVVDAEFTDSELLYKWETLLRHNTHSHVGGTSTNHTTTTLLTPIGCDGVNIYYYTVVLTVTDPAGLSTVRSVDILPDCGTPNTPPVISNIPDQTVLQNGSTGPINFTVGDAETAAVNLQLSASSSAPTLVPLSNIVFGGSGSNRTINVTPAAGQTGSATITVNVSDGVVASSDTFLLTVSSVVAGSQSFTNAAAVAIPSSGAATPYPSTINVSGMGGTISQMTVRLHGFGHSWPSDVDMLLVGPGGQKVILMSDAGGGTAVNNIDLTFSDGAAAPVHGDLPMVSGTFRPSDYTTSDGADTFAGPAPAGPYGTALSVFNGQAANGTWSLYVVDDGPGDQGSLAGGWSLMISTTGGGAPAPAAPTISDIADQVTTINLPTAAIPFTIGDADTPVGSLTLSGSSSSQSLVPNANIVFGGSGANPTVTVTPAAGQTGTATITVTVSDGALTGSDTFVLTVNAVNTAPTISDIGNQTINEDGTTGALNFTVGDGESAAGSLIVTRDSSNPTLVPVGNIVLGGSGANRTATVTLAANQSGTATITITVSDGQLSASDTFVLTVNAVNDAPTISDIGNQSVSVSTATAAIPFIVGDVETAAGSLTVSGASSNQSLVSDGNIVFGGSGANRTVTITPAAGQSGSATITVTTSDGALAASDTFVLTVSSVVTGTQSFTNETALVIPSVGAGIPYPSAIDISTLGGAISQMTVRLHGFGHSWPNDVDMLLVGPGGQKVILMSDAGGGTAVNNIDLTFSDETAALVHGDLPMVSGTFRPSDYTTSDGADSFVGPAPAGPYGTALSVFNGQAANGTWSLYVMDDGVGDQGSLANGWSLTLTTAETLGPASIASVVKPHITLRLADKGMIRLTVTGETSREYAVEASNDLVNWTSIGVQTKTGASVEFIDTSSSNSVRFYRAVSLPTAR